MSTTSNKPSWLFNACGHPHEGEKTKHARNSIHMKSNGRGNSGHYYYKDQDLHTLPIPRYLLTAALHLTKHRDHMLGSIRGRPRRGSETHTTQGFIRACIATTAYLACLMRPDTLPQDREVLTARRPDIETEFDPRYVFREFAEALLGPVALQAIENAAASQIHAASSTAIPDFFGESFSEYVASRMKAAYDAAGTRALRRYNFEAPNEVIQYLTHTYRVRWGSLSEFLSRAVLYLAYQTRDREHELARQRQLAGKQNTLNIRDGQIDYRDI